VVVSHRPLADQYFKDSHYSFSTERENNKMGGFFAKNPIFGN